MESGSEFPRKRLDLYLLLEEAVADGDFESRACGCRVELKGEEPCWMVGSAELLRSALENIVRNAIRYAPPGSAVEVLLDGFEKDGQDWIRATIRDHGPGVAEDAVGHLFEPFFRAPSRGRKASDGTGLGLAIARRAVDLHLGTISAHNAAEGGLVVTISFPS